MIRKAVIRHMCPNHASPLYLAHGYNMWDFKVWFWTDNLQEADLFPEKEYYSDPGRNIPYRWIRRQGKCWELIPVEIVAGVRDV